jgi:ubiquinone/menaquinone biosynthesis C-methylase UbiE
MSLPEIPDTKLWDEDYLRRGRLWGRVPSNLPVPSPGSRILELGCGSGKTAGLLVGDHRETVAIDFSPAAIALNCTPGHKPPGLDLAIADARYLPFRSEAFDNVFAIHVIGHMGSADRIRTAAEVTRVLVRKGILVFRCFSPNDFRFGSGEEIEPGTFRRGTGIITHYFHEPEILDLFSSLTTVSIRSSPWVMRVRGVDLTREEITAVFIKL